MRNIFLVALLISCITTNAQWTQVGQDIDGEAETDNSGVVSLSSDGSVMAIGANLNDGNGSNSGHVRVYENISGTWTQIGQDINGETAGDESGTVSLSSDGSIVAIGAPQNDGNGTGAGHVRVFENISGTWTQVGQDIDGEAANDQSGRHVSLSSDGSVVAIGAILSDGNGFNSGHVRVFENVNGTWTQIGQDIDGEAAYDWFGGTVALDSSGSIVAIGAVRNDGNGTDAGHVRVYENISGTWTQVGQDIDGEAAEDRSGFGLSLSSDGSVVAIGAKNNDGNGSNSGHVRVYQNSSGTWTQVGQDIDGEAADDRSGRGVRLSSDGSIVAIGARLNDGNGTDAGHVRVYENISGTWTQVGQDIDGEAAGDYAGMRVSLSSDGSVVAIGATKNDGTGTDAGHVRVYEFEMLMADFEADNEVICVGSTVNFTNLSSAEEAYDWTFEGGTPYTSTEENPVVTYDTSGYYDVTLQVSNGADSATETKTEYISVLETPDQADTPEGDTNVCTGQSYNYEVVEVLYAQEYEWELSPGDAGTLTPFDTIASLEVADDWTGDFTIRVRATNICGDGDWSDNFDGTVYQSPEEFALEGGGGYCLEADGVEITLDGSGSGIDYELYLDGEATGITVEGTGSEISFGLVTDEGFYEAVASNENCEYNMQNEVQVWIDYPPVEPETPLGPEVICDEASSDYTSEGSDDADSYVWELSPEDAGTITYDGLEAAVEWNTEYSGLAYVSLYGINDCGDGNSSDELEVSVGAPNPVVDGENLVCDWSDEVYEVAENEGSTYTWDVTGGTITEGQGTYMITVSWEGEGNGTMAVEEETAGGCAGESEPFELMIDDCTGIGENDLTDQISLNPNPVTDYILIKSEGTIEAVVVYSLQGQMIADFKISEGQIRIDTESYKPGIYLAKVSVNNLIVTKRFIVK